MQLYLDRRYMSERELVSEINALEAKDVELESRPPRVIIPPLTPPGSKGMKIAP